MRRERSSIKYLRFSNRILSVSCKCASRSIISNQFLLMTIFVVITAVDRKRRQIIW